MNGEVNIAYEMCKLIKGKGDFNAASSITYKAPQDDPRSDQTTEYYITLDNISKQTKHCMWIKKRFSIRIIYGCTIRTNDMWDLMNNIKDCLITTCINKIPDGFEQKIRKIVETDTEQEITIDDKNKCIIIDLIAYILHKNFNL